MVDNLPELLPAAGLYQGASGLHYHDSKRLLHPTALEWVMRLRALKFQSLLTAKSTVLELGVGAGWNLGRLQCARRIGCDTSQFLGERVTSMGIEFITSLEPIPSGTVDLAICHHCLEHLLQPADALKALSRILKPDGRLILHVPWEKEKRYGVYRPDEPNHHLYTWNAQNLGNLVALMGFKIENIQTRRYGYDRFAANLSARLGMGEIGFRFLRVFMINLLPLLEIEVIAKK